MEPKGSKQHKQRSLKEEVGLAGLLLGADGLSSGLIIELFGLPDENKINAILNVLLTTLPLTVAIAIIVVLYGGSGRIC